MKFKNGLKYTITKEETETYVSGWTEGKYLICPFKQELLTDEDQKSTKIEDYELLALNTLTFNLEDFQNFVARVNWYNAGKPFDEHITGVVCRIGIKPNPFGGDKKYVPTIIFEGVQGFDSSESNFNSGVRIGDLPDPSSLEHTTGRYDFAYPCPPICFGKGKG